MIGLDKQQKIQQNIDTDPKLENAFEIERVLKVQTSGPDKKYHLKKVVHS